MTTTLYRVFRIEGTSGNETEVARDTVPNIAAAIAHDRAEQDPGVAVVVRTTNGTLLRFPSHSCRADNYRATCHGSGAVAVVRDPNYQAATPLCLFHLRRRSGVEVPITNRALSLNPLELDEFDDAMTGAVELLIRDFAPDSIPESAVEAVAGVVADSFGMPHDLTTARLVEALGRQHVGVT